MSEKIEQTLKVECPDCKATGLYVGFAEAKGTGVVCTTCYGTGCKVIKSSYTVFTERKRHPDVKRVFATNSGWVLGPTSKGGMPYEDWLLRHSHFKSKTGAFPQGHEDRQHTCPAWFYQSADYDRKPEWKECNGCGTFSSCKFFPTRAKCWERFDKEGL